MKDKCKQKNGKQMFVKFVVTGAKINWTVVIGRLTWRRGNAGKRRPGSQGCS